MIKTKPKPQEEPVQCSVFQLNLMYSKPWNLSTCVGILLTEAHPNPKTGGGHALKHNIKNDRRDVAQVGKRQPGSSQPAPETPTCPPTTLWHHAVECPYDDQVYGGETGNRSRMAHVPWEKAELKTGGLGGVD